MAGVPLFSGIWPRLDSLETLDELRLQTLSQSHLSLELEEVSDGVPLILSGWIP